MLLIKIYRLSHKLYKKNNYPSRKAALLLCKVNLLLNNSYIPASCIIGKNVSFSYGGIGVVIHSRAIIGDNCTIGQGITIGGRTGHGDSPIVGNNVYISAGSRVLGGIKIGDNVVIGANAVVIKDIPSNCVVAGVPAKIIRWSVEKFKDHGVI